MMLAPSGRPAPDNPYLQIAARVRVASKQIVEKIRPHVLTTIGVRLVSWAYQDYRIKSSGGSAGGITWAPLTMSAIISRLAKRSPWRSLQAQRKRLVGDRSARAVSRRADLRARRNDLIAREWSGAKIGVDTGRLANAFRYSEKSSEDAVFRVNVEDHAVTIGASVKTPRGGDYAVFFDRLRPIFGPNFLGAGRAEKLEEMAARAYEDALAGGFA